MVYFKILVGAAFKTRPLLRASFYRDLLTRGRVLNHAPTKLVLTFVSVSVLIKGKLLKKIRQDTKKTAAVVQLRFCKTLKLARMKRNCSW